MADSKLEETHLISDVKLPNDEKSLKAIIDEVKGNITVWEGGVFIPLAFLVLGIALIGTAYQNFQVGKMMSMVILGALALLLLFILIRTMVRRRIPYMVLTPEGLETTVFKTPVPWRGIEDYQINSSKSNSMNIAVGMEFLIDEKLLPEENKTCRGGSYYDNKTKKLMISGFNFRLDTNRDKLIGQINAYRNAALARHKLEMKKYK
ncbi:hypothetical protein [uncultured Bartonella sp.]|uniref:hypothetical protein n=1 Tax=uncultured Bartonella sp. TaxID=104108 RepID=UPI0025D0D374|nr:hypothetical protein [uncultured Bartonella sp.]